MNWLPFVISGLGIGAVYALAAVGLMLLYRTTGVMNFALGAIGAVGAFLAFEIIQNGGGYVAGCLVAIAAAALLSAGYGRFIAPLLADRDIVTRSMGTLGFALVLLGVVGLIWGERPRRIQFPTDRLFVELAGVRLTYTRLAALTIAGAAVVSLSRYIAATRMGLNMRALADNRQISAILGVRVLRVEYFAWGIAGVFSGIAGLLLANLVGLRVSSLTFLVVPAIAAAIVGGLQSLPVTALAAVGIGVLEALLSTIPEIAPYRSAAPFAVALVMIAVSAALPGFVARFGR